MLSRGALVRVDCGLFKNFFSLTLFNSMFFQRVFVSFFALFHDSDKDYILFFLCFNLFLPLHSLFFHPLLYLFRSCRYTFIFLRMPFLFPFLLSYFRLSSLAPFLYFTFLYTPPFFACLFFYFLSFHRIVSFLLLHHFRNLTFLLYPSLTSLLSLSYLSLSLDGVHEHQIRVKSEPLRVFYLAKGKL